MVIKIKKNLHKLYKSVWFFPTILLIPLVIFVSFGINGSSIGVYHTILYGNDSKDPDLLLGRPRTIRSDEWLVNTQSAISQSYVDFSAINSNIGKSQDISVTVDAPYKGWSEVFKPHNLAFFILPFDNAFAFRWWSIGYFLIVSSYFLFMFLMPKKRLVSALLALILFFSPFVQWWYLNGTLSTIAFGMASLLIALKILSEKKLNFKSKSIYCLSLAYFMTSFILILYPPFQIATALVLLVVGIAYLLENKRMLEKSYLLPRLGLIVTGIVLAGMLTGIFLLQHRDIVTTMRNTAYPGHRSELSGGYDIYHFMSSNLSPIFQITSRANNYSIPSLGLTNQSANSNFILIIPFLFIPTLIILFKQYKKTRKIKDWILLFTLILFAFLCIRIFIPKFDSIYKLILLDQVSAKRMLIGFGVLNVLFIASYIKYTSIKNNKSLSYNFVYIYVLLIFIIELLLGYHARQQHPGFIDFKTSLLLSFPIPIVVYLFLTNNIKVALYILLGFSVFSSGLVNPLYKGTGILKDTELSRQIRALDDIAPESIWATESIYIENFASLNGAKSLSGVYSYPQLELWNPLKTNTDADYNRYAHVNFAFDRDSATHIDSYIKLLGADNFQVVTEPCSNFITANKVRYIVTVAMLDNTASCAQLVKEIVYPKQNYFIYELSY